MYGRTFLRLYKFATRLSQPIWILLLRTLHLKRPPSKYNFIGHTSSVLPSYCTLFTHTNAYVVTCNLGLESHLHFRCDESAPEAIYLQAFFTNGGEVRTTGNANYGSGRRQSWTPRRLSLSLEKKNCCCNLSTSYDRNFGPVQSCWLWLSWQNGGF